MLKNLYSMYDKNTKLFMAPLEMVNDADAIRVFTTWVNDPKEETNPSKYPEHFSMWRIGTYDTDTGNLKTDQKELITGNACKEEENKYTIRQLIETIQKG